MYRLFNWIIFYHLFCAGALWMLYLTWVAYPQQSFSILKWVSLWVLGALTVWWCNCCVYGCLYCCRSQEEEEEVEKKKRKKNRQIHKYIGKWEWDRTTTHIHFNISFLTIQFFFYHCRCVLPFVVMYCVAIAVVVVDRIPSLLYAVFDTRLSCENRFG